MHNLLFKTLWVNRFSPGHAHNKKHTVHWRKIVATDRPNSSDLHLSDPESPPRGSTVYRDERGRSSITLMVWRKSIRTDTRVYFCSSDALPDSISYSHTQQCWRYGPWKMYVAVALQADRSYMVLTKETKEPAQSLCSLHSFSPSLTLLTFLWTIKPLNNLIQSNQISFVHLMRFCFYCTNHIEEFLF